MEEAATGSRRVSGVWHYRGRTRSLDGMALRALPSRWLGLVATTARLLQPTLRSLVDLERGR